MTIENDFLVFAGAAGANVISQSAYVADPTLVSDGFQAGLAASNQVNKPIRQASIISAMIADYIVAQSGQPAIDDGTTATLLANFTSSVTAAIPPGTQIAFTSATPPSGFLACPTSLTYISATVYSRLAFAIGSSIGGAGSINAGSFIIGQTYVIETVGSTDFTLIGALANTVGVTFTATGVGAGSGNAWSTIGLPFYPAGYAQVAGTPGASTHGALLAHTHTILQVGPGGPTQNVLTPAVSYAGGPSYSGSTGGTDNLAAGYGVQFCVKY